MTDATATLPAKTSKQHIVAASSAGFQSLSIIKQFLMLAALTASIALGFYVVLWAKDSDYQPLYSDLSPLEASEIAEILTQNNVDFKIDGNTGVVLVNRSKVHEAKMKLAAKGLPHGSGGSGLEILNQPQEFGTSQFVENARYRRAQEVELARTIATIDAVYKARVHLAVPRQSAFSRNNGKSSASVMLDLYPTKELNKGQIQAIAHLVASSVPGLMESKVTVVDQSGRLLSAAGDDGFFSTSNQLDYIKSLESGYSQRIVEILEPIVGAGRVRAKLTADVDFTAQEETSENFNPETKSIRSEKTATEERNGSGALGIPGALSNQPAAGAASEEGGAAGPSSVRQQQARNYELDKSIKHVKKAPGRIIQLSAAIVIDDKIEYNNLGQESRAKYTEEELKNIERIIKDAIGFNEERGDKLSLVSTTFVPQPEITEAPEPSIWEKPWFWPAMKQGLAGILILIIIFVIIKPTMKSLALKAGEVQKINEMKMVAVEHENEKPKNSKKLIREDDSMDKIQQVRDVIKEDSGRVAQVVMNWVGTEDE